VFVGWTLNYEMAFYVLFALGLLTRCRLLGLAITTSMLLLAVVIGAIVRPMDTFGRFYTAPIVLEFALGMGLGIAMHRLPPWRWLKWASYPVALVSFMLLIAGPSLWPHVDRLFVFGLPAAALVASALVMERAGLVVSSPLIKPLGDASYSTYLTHFVITQAATKGALALGIEGVWPVILVCIATFTMVAVTGLAVHAAVERPMSQAARRPLSSPKAPEQLAAPRVSI
jgi:exopolysaccharide production protein ExoZ